MTSADTSITIKVKTKYLQAQLTEKNKYAFAYNIAIHNGGNEKVKLLHRYWLITDADGKKTEVRGPGVIGKQPQIAAGESFVYSSSAVLDTPVGTMEGIYQMQSESGRLFNAPIPVFSLAIPNIIN